MKLKKLILLQLTLFLGLTVMVACERNEECALSAAKKTEKNMDKTETPSQIVGTASPSLIK